MEYGQIKHVDGAHWYLTYLIIFYIISAIYISCFRDKLNKGKYYFIVILIINNLLNIMSSYYSRLEYLYILTGGDYLGYLLIGISLKFILTENKKQLTNYIIFFMSIVNIIISSNIIVFIGIFIFTVIFIILIKYPIKSCKLHLLLYMGKTSFIQYLIHQNIGYIILLKIINLTGHYNICYVGITYIIIFLISTVIYEFYEKKIQNIIKLRNSK